MKNEVRQLQKLAGLIKESVQEAKIMSGPKELEAILSNLSRNISTDSNIPTASKEGLLGAFNEMMDIVSNMLDAEEADSFYDEDEPVSDYSRRRASEMNEQSNPEGDKLVLRFLQGVAKKYDYPVSQAAIFVKDTIKKIGY